VHLEDRPVGWVGAVHPRVGRALELDAEAYVFELRLSAITQGHPPRFSPVSRYPGIRRDLAVVVDENTPWAEVEACIRRAAPEALKAVRLFDVYAGKGVTPGRKSFAIGLILQEISRTLTDVETESATADILAALNENLGATLRE
jgi:phenylalanyl-tRNA synthetase beta chain